MSWINNKINIDEEVIKQEIEKAFKSTTVTRKPQVLTEFAPHYPVVLDIPTYHGTGSNCHPDVLRIPDGFGSQGYTYWMAVTPMPTLYENPSIVASHDGIHWKVPEGLENPIIPENTVADHNSDTDLIYANDKLYMYYRDSYRSLNPTRSRIRVVMSEDGVNWSEPTTCLEYASSSTNSTLLSPAVVYDNGLFLMFMVDKRDGAENMMKSESSDGVTWQEPVVVNWNGLSGRVPWHFDCIKVENDLVGIMNAHPENGSVLADTSLHLAVSSDGGETWNITSEPYLESYYDWEGAGTSNRVYRATLRRVSDSNIYETWYSGRDDSGYWTTAYLPVLLKDNQFIPLEMNSIKDKAYIVDLQ